VKPVATIKLLGAIADFAGFKEKKIKIEKPTKLREIVYIDKIPQERIIILVNHEPATFDTVITDKDYVVIMPVVGGG